MKEGDIIYNPLANTHYVYVPHEGELLAVAAWDNKGNPTVWFVGEGRIECEKVSLEDAIWLDERIAWVNMTNKLRWSAWGTDNHLIIGGTRYTFEDIHMDNGGNIKL